MKSYWSSLKLIWLFVSLLCLIAPVVLPTSRYPSSFLDDPMGTSTVIMFGLSAPMSLLAIPAIMAAGIGFGLGPGSIMAAFLNLLFLFAVGFVQWFWVVPRLSWPEEPGLQTLDLHTHASAAPLGEAHISPDFSFFDSDSKTPVERVIEDYSEK